IISKLDLFSLCPPDSGPPIFFESRASKNYWDFVDFRWFERRTGARQKGQFKLEEIAMKSNVKPIPDGFHAVTPYLTVRGASSAIEFYRRAFGATELFRMPGP